MRREDASIPGSPSSLFSAPSSPAPIHSKLPTPPPPLSHFPSMPSSSRTNVAGPSMRPRQPSSQAKVARKPNWLIPGKIKRLDDPNLKPSSSLPTKASLARAAKSTEVPQSPTTSVMSSTQTPTSATVPHPASMRDEPSRIEQSDVHSPTEPEVPLPPPASMAETVAFLDNIMPPECVLESSLRTFGLLSLVF